MESASKFIAENIKPHWHKPIVGIGFAFFLGLAAYFSAFLKTGDPRSVVGISSGVLVTLFVAAFWVYSHRIPRCPKDKIGIVLAIVADEATEARQIESDFTRELLNRLRQEREASNFHVIVLPEFAATQVVQEERADHFLSLVRGHLILYGFARRRTVEGKEAHVLHLEGLVRHAPLPKELVAAFGKEFGEALPRRLILPKDGDVFAFEVSSGWVDLSVRYVIAIAAHLSGDFAYAEGLFLWVEDKIKKTKSQPSVLQPISRDLPKRLLALYQVWRRLLAQQYAHKRQSTTLALTDKICDKLLAREPNDYLSLLGKAMCHFVLRRDLAGARACLKLCEKVDDAAWRYSVAFLHAYEGDLKAAHEEYRRAFRASVRDVTLPVQCEEFIHLAMLESPAKPQLYFCLGLINYNAKEDFVAAHRDFTAFLAHPECARHPEAKQLAYQLLGRCEKRFEENSRLSDPERVTASV